MPKIADRRYECELFERMLRGSDRRRILLLEGPSERGKSFLLEELAQIAESIFGDRCCARANLKGSLPLAGLLSGLHAELGFENLPDHQTSSIPTPVTANVTVDASGACFNDNNEFVVSPVIYTGERNFLLQRADALVANLHNHETPLVVVIDTYEAATQEVTQWIIHKLLPSVRRNEQLFMVVGGQQIPDHREFHLTWGSLAVRHQLSIISSIDDWYEFACAQHPGFPRHHIETVCLGGLVIYPGIIAELIENIVRQLPSRTSAEAIS